MGVKKGAKKIFQEHMNIVSKKWWEKIFGKIVRKNVFYKHTNIVTEKGGKKRGKKYSRNTRISRTKYGGIKSSEKRFL